jgi:hypothetical protein
MDTKRQSNIKDANLKYDTNIYIYIYIISGVSINCLTIYHTHEM